MSEAVLAHAIDNNCWWKKLLRGGTAGVVAELSGASLNPVKRPLPTLARTT